MGTKKLVLDVQTLQLEKLANRGIGRYTRLLAKALLAVPGAVDRVLVNPLLPLPTWFDEDLISSERLGWTTSTSISRASDGSHLVYLLMSPFDPTAPGKMLPYQMFERDDISLAVVLYDLIPLLVPRDKLPFPEYREYRARLELMRTADLVLAISDQVRTDAIETLGLDSDRVVSIGTAPSPYFRPARAGDDPEGLLAATLSEVIRPFVITLSGDVGHKNVEKLVAAWGALGDVLRERYQLVIAGDAPPGARRRVRDAQRRAGLSDVDVVVTGRISDEVLRALYQRAHLCVLPSIAEGFGLPAAEAVSCGCPVLVSRASPVAYVLDWAEATFDPEDANDMAAAVTRALTDSAFAGQLRRIAAERAPSMSWSAIGDRALGAIHRLDAPGASSTSDRAPRPWIAFVGVLPPSRSRPAERNVSAVTALAETCRVDVFSLSRAEGVSLPDVQFFPLHGFCRLASPSAYDAVVYSLADDGHHHEIYELAVQHPGVVWFHDEQLIGPWLARLAARDGGLTREGVIRELERLFGPLDAPEELLPVLAGLGLALAPELLHGARALLLNSDSLARRVELQREHVRGLDSLPLRRVTNDSTATEIAAHLLQLSEIGHRARARDTDTGQAVKARASHSPEHAEVRSTATLAYNCVCNVEDFDRPDLARVIREVHGAAVRRHGPAFPAGREDRKLWEVAMAVRALRDHGALRPDAEILGIAAGREVTTFWLTNHVRRVFATDLYLDAGAWDNDAPTRMLVEPEAEWPGPWKPQRLVVQHMDALDLRYDDESFDGIFSSSSIEHFGDLRAVGRAAAEACRVLKPGGVLSLSTEFRLAGPAPGLPGALMFSEEEIRRCIIGDLPWRMVDELHADVSEATMATEVLFSDALVDRVLGTTYRSYPHVVLRDGVHVWTSVHLTLKKIVP